MQATTTRIEDSYGTRETPGLLIDPARLWRVEHGAADLFLVRVENGVPVGARKPVARLKTGALLCGIAASNDGYGLLVQPTPGTRIECASWASATEEDLEEFVASLAAPLRTRTSAEADKARLQWPDTTDAWELAREPGGVLTRLLAALVEWHLQEDSRFSERLRSRQEADRANLKAAQRSLAAVLETGSTTQPLSGGGGDPLLIAARAAGDKLGLAIVGPARNSGTPREPIAAIARASGVRVRKVALRGHWWRKDGGPFICYLLESGQPLAALPLSPSRYELFDPVTRTRRRVDSRLAAQLAPHGHCLYRSFPKGKLNWQSLARFGILGLARDGRVIVVAGVLSGLLGLLPPILTGILFDTVIPATDHGQLGQLFAILLAAAVSVWLLGLMQSFALLRVESRMDAGLQAALWDRLLSLPATFFRSFSAGDLAMRSLAISSIRQFLTGAVLSAVLSGVFSLFSLALLFYYGSFLAVPALGLILISFFITVGTALLQLRIQRRLTELSGRVAGLLPQILGGIAKLRVAGAEERAFARWALRFAEQKRLAVASRRISIALSIIFPLFRTATIIILFACLAHPGNAGITTGAFLAFQTAFLQVLAGASELGSALVSSLAAVPLYERAKPILEAIPEPGTDKSDPGEITGDIELSNVVFRYRSDLPPVLKGVSLHIRAGEFAAIVGSTGSGKSTLFRLLLGFESPESGSIFYDGQDLAGLDVQAVRRQTGVVLQQGGVLGGDLFSNIVGAAPLTMDDAWEAARMAGLEEDIRNMPMGMHTVLPDGGLGLSGGQRQRLQIARAIVHRPRLILFDEATSALDNRTQAIVTQSLAQLRVTRIVIAHRLTTIREAGRIFALNEGLIVESGTYDELMANNGFFAGLARRQLA